MANTNDQNMIINATTFSPDDDTKYTKPKINKSGGKSVGVLNSVSGKSLYLSTPLMLTWGVSEFVDEKTGRRTYDMSLQFPRDDYRTEATDKFLENITAFQSKLKADAIANSKDWLNKAKMSAEVVDALFHPMLKHPKDPETGEPDYTRAPTLRVKLEYWDEKFNCEVYDVEQKLVFPDDESSVMPMDLIEKSSNVAVVIRCGGLWFANGKFGCTWKLVQAVVKPKASLKGRCLITLTADDAAKMQAQSTSDDDDDDVAVVLADDSEDDNDDDDDNDDADEVAAPPTPPPAPKAKAVKKKVVRKKKVAEAEA